VNVDPETKKNPNTRWRNIRNAVPEWSYRAELKLPDGRIIMRPFYPYGTATGVRPFAMQMMDRDGPVSVTDESAQTCCGCLAQCPNSDVLCCDPQRPIAGFNVRAQTTGVKHPQSSDETRRKGYMLHSPASINGATKTHCAIQCAFCLVCICPGCLDSCFPTPNLHFQLQEAQSGQPVEGVQFFERGRSLREMPSRVPNGDTFEFTDRATLQVRKDLLAAVIYRLIMEAVRPEERA
jgi:hypothetical protein